MPLLSELRARDLVVVLAVTDAGLAALTLLAARQPLLAVMVAAGALLLVLALGAFEHHGELLVGGLAGLLAMLPLGVLTASRVPHGPVHDSVLMSEAAAQRLLDGHSPYGHDYVDSLARAFYIPEVPANFGLAHYVYPPASFLIDVPIRWLAAHGLDIDFAWAYLPALGLVLLAAAWLGRDRSERIAVMAAAALSPLFLFDYLNLINDVFFWAPLLAALAATRRRHFWMAGAFLGLALCFKQTAVLLAPFLFLMAVRQDGRSLLGMLAMAASVAALLVGPFLLAEPRGMITDLAGFFYGSGVDSYPVRGDGLAGLALKAGVLASRWDSFPTAIGQLVVALPLLGVGLVRLWRKPSWPALFAWAALFSLAVFFCGRVLAPNYLDFGLDLGLIGFALWLRERQPAALPVSAESAEVRPPAATV